jgi:hypothetical protein
MKRGAYSIFRLPKRASAAAAQSSRKRMLDVVHESTYDFALYQRVFLCLLYVFTGILFAGISSKPGRTAGTLTIEITGPTVPSYLTSSLLLPI